MAIRKDVYKYHRLMPVYFHRATQGNPDPERPDMDDRGYTGSYHSPIVGITEGRTIIVRLTRQNIEDTALLFVTSSNIGDVNIVDPAGGALPNTRDMDIKLQGVTGGNPREARIQVRFGSLTGTIIHELSVWVFTQLRVRITPHIVTIAQAGGGAAPIGSVANRPPGNINNIMDLVRSIWFPCGIIFLVGAVRNDNVTLATAGVVSIVGPPYNELNTVLATNWIPNTINVYFVHRIGGDFQGFGFSRQRIATFGLVNPGILLADTTAVGNAHDVISWVNDLAHEIGHFFGLSHPENREDPNEREDTWSRRMLMHNFNNPMAQQNNWKDNVGYGHLRRGCLITMKNLAQLTTDGECTTARAKVNSRVGPY